MGIDRTKLDTMIKRTFDLKTYKSVAEFLNISERHYRRFRNEPDKYFELEQRIIDMIKSYEINLIIIAKSYLGIKGYKFILPVDTQIEKIVNDFSESMKIEEIFYVRTFKLMRVNEIRNVANAYQDIIENYDNIEHDYDYFISKLIEESNLSKGWKTRMLRELEIDMFYLG